MGRKIFVSYKYSDSKVKQLSSSGYQTTTARHYVNELYKVIADNDHIYKGENDNESLESFKRETIASKLRDKIFDSTMTIVLVSKGMKDPWKAERDQWMPWEIAYSLKEMRKGDRLSSTNGIIAIALPDEFNSYDYYIQEDDVCGCQTLMTNFLFRIMRENIFNIKKPVTSECNGTTLYHGHHSYITSVKWQDFIQKPHLYFAQEQMIKDNAHLYNICKSIEDKSSTDFYWR